MRPSGISAAPEVNRLLLLGSEAGDLGGGSEAEWRGTGRAGGCQDSQARLGQKELVEIWRNVGRARETEGCRMHTQTGNQTGSQKHSGHYGYTHNMFMLTA